MPMTFLTAATLWPALRTRTLHALQCGALQPIETALTYLDQDGVRFAVREVSSLARKEAARHTDASTAAGQNAPNAPRRNPFLPVESDLCIGDISPTHVALLNKFNVIDDHLLIVTRRFVPQTALLDQDDFAALLVALRGADTLGFYNGGEAAGASQPHKHLQAVPLPLDQSGLPTPIEALFDSLSETFFINGLPFRHAFARLDLMANDAQHSAWQTYRTLLQTAGIDAVDVEGIEHQNAPYNLLVTRRWMLVVPRSAERVEGISLNALGFAGSLFVRDAQQRATLAQIGPMTALARVALPLR
jgi:ATP adenylyltransferase